MAIKWYKLGTDNTILDDTIQDNKRQTKNVENRWAIWMTFMILMICIRSDSIFYHMKHYLSQYNQNQCSNIEEERIICDWGGVDRRVHIVFPHLLYYDKMKFWLDWDYHDPNVLADLSQCRLHKCGWTYPGLMSLVSRVQVCRIVGSLSCLS